MRLSGADSTAGVLSCPRFSAAVPVSCRIFGGAVVEDQGSIEQALRELRERTAALRGYL